MTESWMNLKWETSLSHTNISATCWSLNVALEFNWQKCGLLTLGCLSFGDAASNAFHKVYFQFGANHEWWFCYPNRNLDCKDSIIFACEILLCSFIHSFNKTYSVPGTVSSIRNKNSKTHLCHFLVFCKRFSIHLESLPPFHLTTSLPSFLSQHDGYV